MKRVIIVSLLCLVFCSCAAGEYSDSLDSRELAKQLTGEISEFGDYVEYDDNEINDLLGLSADGCDVSVIYSKDSDDQGEIGIIRAASEADAKEVLREAQEYLEQMRVERRAFVESYLPRELSKLSSAEARRFGSYVIYTILESEKSTLVFDKVEEALKTA